MRMDQRNGMNLLLQLFIHCFLSCQFLQFFRIVFQLFQKGILISRNDEFFLQVKALLCDFIPVFCVKICLDFILFT